MDEAINTTRAAKKIMQERHISQQQMADATNRPQSSIARMFSTPGYGIRKELIELYSVLGYDLHLIAVDRMTGETINVD